jgi:hypothetical protein
MYAALSAGEIFWKLAVISLKGKFGIVYAWTTANVEKETKINKLMAKNFAILSGTFATSLHQ